MTFNENEHGHPTLADALAEVKLAGKIDKLDFIRPHPFTEADEFQKELIAAFKELAPDEWAAAEKSSGNMHNPKISPLWKHLSEAFMRTSLAEEISKDLDPYGLIISDFGHEKLSYQEMNGKRMIRGIFHISIAPKKESDAESEKKNEAPAEVGGKS